MSEEKKIEETEGRQSEARILVSAEENSSEPEETPAEESAFGQSSDKADASLNQEEGRGEAILEGLLFLVGDDGISLEQAAETLGVSSERCEELFAGLKERYSGDAYGIEVTEFGGIYRFLSKSFLHDYARKLFQMGKAATLSQAALETLAIIAYKGPITRVEIEEIRGVGADMMLRKLLARDLIRENGRSDAPGRPILYEVTEEFMNSFKLMSLKELPELPKFGQEEESEDLFRQ